MTTDQLMIHWREVLTVPTDEDPVTRKWAVMCAAVLFEELAGMADLLGTVPPTEEERALRARAERSIVESERRIAAIEAIGIEVPPSSELSPDTQRLRAAERERDELEARVRRGELVEKADVVAAIDQGLVAALQHVREEVRRVRQHLSGDWGDDQVGAWWTTVVDGAFQKLHAPHHKFRT